MSQYLVQVYATPMSFPLNFTIHSWVEITCNTHTTRYDFWGYPGLNSVSESHGFIYKNLFPKHLGTTFSPFANANDLTRRQSGKVIASCSGAENSAAHRAYTTIASLAFTYPHRHTYHMIFGPNCNSYTAWLLTLVPETRLALPWYTWGKNYTSDY